MAEMRLMERFRAQILTDYDYTHDTTYSKFILRDNLGADTRVTAETEITIGATWQSTTVDFLLPRSYRYKTILDGFAFGSIKMKLFADNKLEPTTTTSFKGTASLITKTTGGTVTTLGSATLKQVDYVYNGGGTGGTLIVDIPFWITLINKPIPPTELLLLRFVLQALKDPNLTNINNVYYETTLNQDDTFVEIPIVP